MASTKLNISRERQQRTANLRKNASGPPPTRVHSDPLRQLPARPDAVQKSSSATEAPEPFKREDDNYFRAFLQPVDATPEGQGEAPTASTETPIRRRHEDDSFQEILRSGASARSKKAIASQTSKAGKESRSQGSDGDSNDHPNGTRVKSTRFVDLPKSDALGKQGSSVSLARDGSGASRKSASAAGSPTGISNQSSANKDPHSKEEMTDEDILAMLGKSADYRGLPTSPTSPSKNGSPSDKASRLPGNGPLRFSAMDSDMAAEYFAQRQDRQRKHRTGDNKNDRQVGHRVEDNKQGQKVEHHAGDNKQGRQVVHRKAEGKQNPDPQIKGGAEPATSNRQLSVKIRTDPQDLTRRELALFPTTPAQDGPLMTYITSTGRKFKNLLDRFRHLTITNVSDGEDMTVVGNDKKEFQTTLEEYTAVKDWIFWQEPQVDSDDDDMIRELGLTRDPQTGRAQPKRSPERDANDEKAAQREREQEKLRKQRDRVAKGAFVELRDVQQKIAALKTRHEEREDETQRVKAVLMAVLKDCRAIVEKFLAYKELQDQKEEAREIDMYITRANNQNVAITHHITEFLHAQELQQSDAMLTAMRGVRAARMKMMDLANIANKRAEKHDLGYFQDLAGFFFATNHLMKREWGWAEPHFEVVTQWHTIAEGKAAKQILKSGLLRVERVRGFVDYRDMLDAMADLRWKREHMAASRDPGQLDSQTGVQVEQNTELEQNLEQEQTSEPEQTAEPDQHAEREQSQASTQEEMPSPVDLYTSNSPDRDQDSEGEQTDDFSNMNPAVEKLIAINERRHSIIDLTWSPSRTDSTISLDPNFCKQWPPPEIEEPSPSQASEHSEAQSPNRNSKDSLEEVDNDKSVSPSASVQRSNGKSGKPNGKRNPPWRP